MIILVGGGSRSGKSSHALQIAARYPRPWLFVATAELRDEEMRARAAAHQAERGTDWLTLEEPVDLPQALAQAETRGANVVVLDCLTLWSANVLPLPDRESRLQIAASAAAASPIPIICVTNEVGCGIVPDNPLAREFRDFAGYVNQAFAREAAEVYWMVFGIPLRAK